MKKDKKDVGNTGRLKEGLDQKVIDIIFGKDIDSAIENELPYSTQIDQAHLIMLAEQKIIPHDYAIKLLEEIDLLQKSNFKDLRGKNVKRGWYLSYEDYLINRLGLDIGGSLHMARSRNDLYATVFRLKLREPFTRIIDVALNLRSTLIKLSRRYSSLLIPLHTQMQPALPSVVGHYLLAIDQALSRDIQDLIEAFTDVEYCPLGACAVGGTGFSINPERTAELLGFIGPKENSIDSVASYDFVLRLLSAMSVMGVTISRLATDIHLWTTQEFNFFRLPDRLSGSSSILPQKTNPFILEHIKGRAASQIGYLVSAVAAMQKVPFSNAIEVKKEGAPHIWKAFKELSEAFILIDLVLNGLIPEKDIMSKNKAYDFITASSMADFLVRKTKRSFRDAHKEVGEIVNNAISSGKAIQEIAKEYFNGELSTSELNRLEFSKIVKGLAFGGGPGGGSLTNLNKISRESQKVQLSTIKKKKQRWLLSERKLAKVVTEYIKGRYAYTGK